MATIKELEKELAKAKKLVVRVSEENERMTSILKEVEPALAQANEQVEELRSAIDNLTVEKQQIQGSLDMAFEMRDNYMSEFEKANKDKYALSRDLEYEKRRRISAENKLFDLEQRLLNVTNTEYEPREVQAKMVGLRIDRHGEIA
jgi:chromosome segregation ATPase